MSTPKAEIRKNIPVPEPTPRIGKNMELLLSMEPGDSRHWPLKEEESATRLYRVAKKLGLRILIRKVKEDDPDGVGIRMWRLE